MQALEMVDFKSGQIKFLAPFVDFSRPFVEQLDTLSEDLIQVEYGAGCILDVGWYPEYDEKGSLVIQVIKNKDWDSPVFRKDCREKDSFFYNLDVAINIAESQR